MALKSINPFTNQVIGEYEEFSDEKVEMALNLTVSAFEEWKNSYMDLRKSLMIQASKILIENKDEYARSITSEMGKPIRESIAEIEKCSWVCQYYAENAADFLRPEIILTDATESFIHYEPLGPILGIMPWNFPFWQVFRFAVPTIMAGNTVLLKHASNVQLCAKNIESIFLKAGFPKGIFQNLVIGSSRIEKVIESDTVKAVSLTGSEAAGSKVAECAGRKIKKSLLELGGSNSFVVLDDADLDNAVETGVKARMQNAGQSCIAAKRFIIHEKIADQFISMFDNKLQGLRTGDPAEKDTEIGPLSSVQQAETVWKQISRSVEMGARIIRGGRPEGAFYPPTLLVNVRPGMPVFDEEVFGPVAPVIISRDEQEAVNLSNLSDFGLGVSLFTGNYEKAMSLIPLFNEGSVFINAMVKSDPRLPFGGIKKSGYGRELSQQGIREFVNVKTVYIKKLNNNF
ncbi:MAG TPA: NAD-dependent succinate-semialdehyde dehydrogenase [Bacteroidales bacterium]|nr:NAD-dependent succinate-semialdehyde dehydrogenase [Bacteroidales bacterium]